MGPGFLLFFMKRKFNPEPGLLITSASLPAKAC